MSKFEDYSDYAWDVPPGCGKRMRKLPGSERRRIRITQPLHSALGALRPMRFAEPSTVTLVQGRAGMTFAEVNRELDAIGKSAGELLWSNRLYEPLTKIAKEDK